MTQAAPVSAHSTFRCPWLVCAALMASSCGSSAAQESSSTATEAAQTLTPAEASSSIRPITILEETPLRVITNESIDSKRTAGGTPLALTIIDDVIVDGVLAIPRGATVHGEVVRSKKSGALTGSPELILTLRALQLGGRIYPLYSYQFKVTGTSKTLPTEIKALHGAEVGAVVGAFGTASKAGVTDTARAVNMTAGAAVGAGVGTLVSAATPGPGISIPAESQVEFHLASPITVTPVSAKEAARMAQGLHRGGPVLYVRGETP